MDGLMMDFPLTLAHIFDRAGRYFAKTEIVSRRPDKSIHRTTYGEFHQRAQKLANALQRLGVKQGERCATLAWNHSRHLEAYFAIPLMGAVLHTLNSLPSADHLSYILNHPDPPSLLQLIQEEKVTCAAGVPTVWIAMLEALDKEPQRWNVKSLKQMVVGGSAAPQAMIEAYEKRHGLHILHAWGMTEMSPV